MNVFGNQIEERRAADQELLENAFLKAAGAVLGDRGEQALRDERYNGKDAIADVLKYYHCKPLEIPESMKTTEEQLDFALLPHGIMRRSVELQSGWYRDAFGPILAFTKEGKLPVALIPGKLRGYTFTDVETGTVRHLNSKTEPLFEKDAFCFYRPLPQKALKVPDLLRYMKSCVTTGDIAFVILLTFLVTLAGLIMPRLIQLLTGPVLSSGKGTALIGVAISMCTVTLTTQLLASVNGLASERLNTKISLGVESSMMMRVLSFPTAFFRDYSPGELKSRMDSVGQLSDMLVGIVMTTSLTSLTSLLYVTQIFRFAPVLVVPSVLIVLVTVLFSVISTFAQARLTKQQMEIAAKESGLSYGLITGVQKLKLSGAEKRGFAKWLNVYAEGARATYQPPVFLKVNSVISTAITLIGTIVLYCLAVKSKVTPSDYYAFTAAYGMLMSAFLSVSAIALSAAQIRPALSMAEPFLHTVPETSEEKERVTSLSGKVELDHVSFRYDKNGPYVLDDLSLSVKPGEYLAIVGRTGCGKSTLVRLLLGFEKPEKGSVYYDSRDLAGLDLPSLRRKIGTVMQDAGLFQGDIYSNIVITAPQLTMDDAWEAAETAGIADDIRAFPMGMQTLVSEGGGGISGGQKQRLMIARAIAPKPKLLIFDEATSALDNKTQKQVSEALDSMGCTRIVIAHRLSTIRHCDRIVVLDGGKIIEDGTYDELIEKEGCFAELVKRQRLDVENSTVGNLNQGLRP